MCSNCAPADECFSLSLLFGLGRGAHDVLLHGLGGSRGDSEGTYGVHVRLQDQLAATGATGDQARLELLDEAGTYRIQGTYPNPPCSAGLVRD